MDMRPFTKFTLTLVAASAMLPMALATPPDGPAVTPPTAQAWFAPFDDLEAVTLSQLRSARRSIRIAHYNPRSEAMAAALVELRGRGVQIEIVSDLRVSRQPWNTLDDRLESLGFPILRRSGAPGLGGSMHHKVTLIDDEVVLTGSYNWNATARLVNEEHLLVLRDPKLAKAYRLEIDELWGRRREQAGSPVAPDYRYQVFFSPEDDTAAKVCGLIEAARETIDVAMYAFRDQRVANVLCAAARRGVRVRLVSEVKQARDTRVDEQVAAAGGHVVIAANRGSAFSAMHQKYAILDGKVVIAGACNWSRTGFEASSEDLLILRDADLADRFRRDFSGLLARYSTQPVTASASNDPPPAVTSVHLLLRHPGASTEERVVVRGDGIPAPGLPLLSHQEIQPAWSGRLRLPTGARVEYRYAILHSDGTATAEPGPPRVLEVDAAGTPTVREDTWRTTPD